jgi:DNA-binding HxlR family transcriptional regulator
MNSSIPSSSVFTAHPAAEPVPESDSTATGSAAANLEPKAGCIASAMEIIGNKWTALILRDLAAGPKRFSELEKSVGNINPRTLSQRLDDLEQQGIIIKEAATDSPTRPEYQLTDKGEDLLPVLRQMAAWGTKYYDTNDCP